MPDFNGFNEGKQRLIPLPAQFFTELLPVIDDLNELRLVVYFFWRLDQMEGAFRCLRRSDLTADERLLNSLGQTPALALKALDEALGKAVQRGALLSASLTLAEGEETLYFLNSPRGRAALQAIQKGSWRPSGEATSPIEILPEPPNIFRLYEDHIGALTPLIADALKDAEQTYPADWIEEAFRIAAENNKRNWRYVATILERWKQEGHHARGPAQKDRRDTEKDGRRYVKGKYSEDIEH